MPRLDLATVQDKQNGLRFDTQEIPAANTALRFSFFNARTAGASGRHVTNMVQAGAMPWPEALVVNQILAYCTPTQAAPYGAGSAISQDALQEIFHCATLRFTVANKVYLDDWPLDVFQSGIHHDWSNPTDAAQTYKYKGDLGRLVSLPYPVELLPNEQFAVEINYGQLATPVQQVALRVTLMGTWVRAVQ